MSGNLIREVRRSVLTHWKNDATLIALVPAGDIFPSTVPDAHGWPFLRWDAPNSIPMAEFLRGSAVSFMAHAFAKPRYTGATMIETAEDHCSRITSALHASLHRNRLSIGMTSFATMVTSSRVMQDGAEADAYHGVVNCVARCLLTV